MPVMFLLGGGCGGCKAASRYGWCFTFSSVYRSHQRMASSLDDTAAVVLQWSCHCLRCTCHVVSHVLGASRFVQQHCMLVAYVCGEHVSRDRPVCKYCMTPDGGIICIWVWFRPCAWNESVCYDLWCALFAAS